MDLESFQNRIVPFKNKLFRYSQHLLGSEEEAEDVVQDVFMKVWDNRKSMKAVLNWEAWCMRMARNLSLDRLRSKKRKNTFSMPEGFDLAYEDQTPLEKTENQESMKRVIEWINELPPKQKEIIHLRDVEGYSYQEIVDILELDMNQVKVNLFRARNTIREKLIKANAYGL